MKHLFCFLHNLITGPPVQEMICAVINPVAGRKPPASNVILHGVAGTSLVPEFSGATYAVQFDRAVKTGRWTTLPDNLLNPDVPGPLAQRLVFKPQRKARGQRFGIFASQLYQTNGRDVGHVFSEALCVAQENSSELHMDQKLFLRSQKKKKNFYRCSH